MKFIDSNQSIIKRLNPELFNGKSESSMGADQNLVGTFKESTH